MLEDKSIVIEKIALSTKLPFIVRLDQAALV
jgi:hypothetical protein